MKSNKERSYRSNNTEDTGQKYTKVTPG